METAGKVLSLNAAIEKYVHSGDFIALGGFVTNRCPYALVREIVRQKINNLYVESGASGGDLDLLVGAGCVQAIICSYVANSGFTQVSRRFRAAIESNAILFDDLSLDVQTIAYHGAALGLPYVPVKNMLGSGLVDKCGISAEQRALHPKLPPHKYLLADSPFYPGERDCLVPTPRLDVALLHVQRAASDGSFIITGPQFQDLDMAMAARHTIISCEELVSPEMLRHDPSATTCTGLVVDAVVLAPWGAHPSQCYGFYDYDPHFLHMYDKISRTQEQFDKYVEEYVVACADHKQYLAKFGADRLAELKINPEVGYADQLERGAKGGAVDAVDK